MAVGSSPSMIKTGHNIEQHQVTVSTMSYRKNADANRDALFGPPSGGGPKHKKNAAANRDALFGDAPSNKASSSRPKSSKPASSTSRAVPAAAPPPTSQGYKPKTRPKKSAPRLSEDARAAKLAEANDYKKKANDCMQSGFFKKPDPVAASTYLKRTADCFQVLGDIRQERLYRLQCGLTNLQIGAWASAAGEYTRAGELALDDDSLQAGQQRLEAANAHEKASEAWTNMNEKAKAAASKVQAAMAMQHGFDDTMLNEETMKGLEAAVEAHVSDVFNPYARYRQTGQSAFVGPDEDVEHPSEEAVSMAREHVVSRSYAYEPVHELTYLFASKGEFASALYAAGAASYILEAEGLSTLTLSRAYVMETILTLALGDPIQAEQVFLNRHVQKTSYLNSRECKLAEDLFRAVKMMDSDALEEARSSSGSNRAALANLNAVMRDVVYMLRVSGVARKQKDSVEKTSRKSKPKEKERPLGEVLAQKTGYEDEVAAGAAMNADDLEAELGALDFLDGDDDDDDLFGTTKSKPVGPTRTEPKKTPQLADFDESEEELSDDDFDLR